MKHRRELHHPAFGSANARLGEDLKVMFDTLTAGPMPDRLVHLAMALEDALERGDIRTEGPRLN